MKKCFVIQGYGKKTDYTDGRVLDLDASYEIIKQAVQAAGLECIRADEIVHSGTIDVPMYDQLLNADVVIADLSTYNVNAAFELGVRYALRPHTTIVLAEDKFKNPFDLSHIVTRPYHHLGEEIGFREANRLMKELKEAIEQIVLNPQTDSPVYTYIPGLQPPAKDQQDTKAARSAAALETTTENNPSAKEMLELALAKIKQSDFSGARELLEKVEKLRPNDCFVVQQLALAIYKSKKPTVIDALHDACHILWKLSPESSNNPETLGLWGAIHKRLWELENSNEYLDQSITAYERGFDLKQDYYNGINLAFLLNIRALEALKAGRRDDAIADSVLAGRVRKDVIRYATPLAEAKEESSIENRYWVVATLWEAVIGLGDKDAALKWEAEAKAMHVADWMQETRENQGTKLQEMLRTYSELISKENEAKP